MEAVIGARCQTTLLLKIILQDIKSCAHPSVRHTFDEQLNGLRYRILRRRPHQPSVRWQSIFCRCSRSLEQSTHRPQDCYLFNGRFQTSLEDLALQKDIRLTFRLLLLQLFYQCFYYYHYHLRYHYRCNHYYHHHLMLCAIGLYIYCRRRNRNDCFSIIITAFCAVRQIYVSRFFALNF